jgi:molecular chaperone GrpE
MQSDGVIMAHDKEKKKNDIEEEEDEFSKDEKDSIDIIIDDPLEIVDVSDSQSTEKNNIVEDYKDRFIRAQADFQNYQKRIEREFTDFKAYSNSRLVEDLLMIIDDFECALSLEEDGSKNEFIKGFEMIYKNLLGVLQKEGLCEIKAENEKFDPWKHEAVDMIPTNDYPEHTVLGVIQRGYMFKDKVLRPAKVRVSTKSEKEKIKIDD